ncbi:Por secretion system C-terminal sorting domain containing protein [Flavobacterium limnosediminis JC2902]|uniref:Por secretion system C-terminal sorting domain containing protein n=1 Tax=Flavobacterium limnosediminis JC2902 TaxID=1341181 RepID=V6SMB2_9FLAO|nr:T9SS type A sorting domain-containing protein [Flavobacterium limnosediminis]ESU27372.1 Por secretion system C-terminal sorting domain containing protein [Flavobacterium limnosediminis JC2902]
MKKTLLFTSFVALSLLGSQKTIGQNLQTIPIQSGFNADVIANGVGSASTSTNSDVDGVSYAFVSRDFQVTAASPALTYGLPVNGLINSAVSSPAGLSYQLASYSGNNALRLQNTNDSGTLLLTNPLAAVNLYMLATGGSGACTVNATVNFTDATSQTFTNISISDWYGGSNFAIQGIGRINISNDGLESGGGTNPRLYQIPLAISAGNQSKLIQSITVTKSGTGGIPNIFAFSADAYTSCPGPSNITYTSTTDGGIFNWTAPSSAPSSGYQYYYSSSSTPPTASTPPTGNIAAGVTTLTLTGLNIGATYYLWVRSNCGADQGFWQMKMFTTGQVVTTYTAGDINTEYASPAPTTTSSTSCPATLTINVPPGYQIGSTDVSYSMTGAGGGYMSEQRSFLVCTTNSASEAALASGVGNGGTYSYNRTGLTIANGLTGNVSFELRAWRTWGGTGCGTNYNKVDNNTWKVTVTLVQAPLSATEVTKQQEIRVYPTPFTDMIHIDKADEIETIVLSDLAGKKVKTIAQPQYAIYLGDLTAGVYFLNMTLKDGSVRVTKAIKK